MNIVAHVVVGTFGKLGEKYFNTRTIRTQVKMGVSRVKIEVHRRETFFFEGF